MSNKHTTGLLRWLSIFSPFMTLLLLSPRNAVADFIIDIRDKTIVAGSSDTIDITIRSTGSDALGVFSYYLRISPVVESGGSLRFASTAAQTTLAKDEANYVFGTDSQFLSATRQENNIFEIVGSDFASSDVVIDGTERLLARVVVEHNTATPLTATGSYRVSLVKNTSFTFFQDFNSNDIGIAPESFSNFGTINIVTTAVPEPCGLALAVLPVLLATRFKRRIRSRAAAIA